jgi:hypothetical protein
MYKNSVVVKIKNQKAFSMISYKLSSDVKENFYILLQEYVPTFIRDIIPVDEYKYDITWISKDEFDRFILDDRYNQTVEELKNFSAIVVWV